MMGFSLMMKMKQLLRRAEARPTPAKRRDYWVSRMIGFSLMMKMKLCCCGGLKSALRSSSGVIAGLRA